eukprot:345017-Prorocentrum_minimum.AAC.1
MTQYCSLTYLHEERNIREFVNVALHACYYSSRHTDISKPLICVIYGINSRCRRNHAARTTAIVQGYQLSIGQGYAGGFLSTAGRGILELAEAITFSFAGTKPTTIPSLDEHADAIPHRIGWLRDPVAHAMTRSARCSVIFDEKAPRIIVDSDEPQPVNLSLVYSSHLETPAIVNYNNN